MIDDDDEDDVRMPRFKIKRDDSTKLRNAQSSIDAKISSDRPKNVNQITSQNSLTDQTHT